MKHYYQDESCTIYHGDCREILPCKSDLVLTDVTYGEVNREDSGLRNLDKGSGDKRTMTESEMFKVINASAAGSVYIWCGIEQVSFFKSELLTVGFSPRLCIWEKSNPSPMNGQFLWLNSIECCLYGKLPKATFNEFCQSSVFRGAIAEQNGHPTPKPEWLFKRLIKASSNAGDLVFDPFMGSGTTLRAAKDLGRKAIGIELEERYCEIAAKRLAQEVLAL
jgi:DNA modification methylase